MSCVFVCVRMFFFVYTVSLIQKLTEVLIDILNTNIKVFKSHKVQTPHFYGDNTTRVRFPLVVGYGS